MSDIPIARIKRAGYENVTADCPRCDGESIFNRASDLCTFEPIAGRNVSCQSCGELFRIVSDSVNPPHETLIFDCYELVERKHYMNCILSLTQAYEVFFSLFFRVQLLYKPFWADPNRECDALNQLSDEFHKKIKNHTFHSMRALFLQHLVDLAEAKWRAPKDLAEAKCVVAKLHKRPEDGDIEKCDAKLVPLLKKLKATTIHDLRNSIVHKQAYRPTRNEAELALKETEAILFPLTYHLDLRDGDINSYMS